MSNNLYSSDKDLDDKLVNVLRDCPYEGPRKECSFYEIREMELTKKLDFIKKMDDSEKIKKWRKHLECMVSSVAR